MSVMSETSVILAGASVEYLESVLPELRSASVSSFAPGEVSVQVQPLGAGPVLLENETFNCEFVVEKLYPAIGDGAKPVDLVKTPESKLEVVKRRPEKERKAGFVMAAGVAGLLVVQLGVVRPAIERKLVKRANSVLALDGSAAVKVSASGRDLVLAGYVATEDAKKRAISLVRARRGVRVVDGADLVVDAGLAAVGGSLSLGEAPAIAAPSPVRTGDGAGDQGVVDAVPVATDSADAAIAETAAALEAERSKPMRRAKIVAKITSGKVSIEGNVPSEEARDQLLGRTRQNLGEENVSDLLVLPTVSEERADLNDYRRVGQLLSIISSFPGAQISFNYDRGILQLSGTVTTNNDLALALGEIKKLVPDDSLLTTQLSVGSTTTAIIGETASSTIPA